MKICFRDPSGKKDKTEKPKEVPLHPTDIVCTLKDATKFITAYTA
jgi:hypothetical protein